MQRDDTSVSFTSWKPPARHCDINLDIVWDTVLEDIPPLVADIEKISIEIAKQKNESFRYFIENYNCETSRNDGNGR